MLSQDGPLSGKEGEGESPSWFESIKASLLGAPDPVADSTNPPPVNAVINIFSVASGHLYERFMSIMFLSVMRQTTSTVKFWLIEDFLSPSFKDFVPLLAAEYGFSFEFVTYKWPHWLRHQTVKQRTIWGYKVSIHPLYFLDSILGCAIPAVSRQGYFCRCGSGRTYRYEGACRSGSTRACLWIHAVLQQ